jgi:hypothetical protein
MWRYVAVQDLASLVLDGEKAIEHSGRHGRHREEIEGSDYLAVILEKWQPAFGRKERGNGTLSSRGVLDHTVQRDMFENLSLLI